MGAKDTPKRTPDMWLYWIKETDSGGIWLKIGVAWAFKGGYSMVFDLIPAGWDGKNIVMKPAEVPSFGRHTRSGLPDDDSHL